LGISRGDAVSEASWIEPILNSEHAAIVVIVYSREPEKEP
jgi:hypothetical protein